MIILNQYTKVQKNRKEYKYSIIMSTKKMELQMTFTDVMEHYKPYTNFSSFFSHLACQNGVAAPSA